MDSVKIVREIKRLALDNGGDPLGERAFYKQAGLTLIDLRRAGFANYGEARERAGFGRGSLQGAYSEDELFEPLARLAREKGRFPTKGEIDVARFATGTPSYSAYSRSTRRGPLRERFVGWCSSKPEFADVAELLQRHATPRARPLQAPSRKVVTGFVYLLRYGSTGRDFKIGCTDNVDRRESQIDMMSPTDVRRVHVIETDDPSGIERYWHERFASKRVKNKEIFRLTPEDVAAFKRRKYQ